MAFTGRPSDEKAFADSALWNPTEAEVERVMGIEPTLSAWEAEVLPLNYTRKINPDISVVYLKYQWLN